MLRKLGPLGIAGILIVIVGVALVAQANLQIAAGIALVLGGLGLIVRSLVSGVLRTFGLG